MNTLLKTLIVGTMISTAIPSYAAVIASMPNQAGGKIVLTDEACIHRGKNYPNLYKSYFYTNSGLSGDGCWTIEDGSETITVIWLDTGDTKRYPIVNFDIRRK
jgi:hypothetical protein